MSVGLDILAEGQSARLEYFGQLFTHLDSGESFTGVIESAPAVDPDSELGSDLRELSILHTQRSEVPAAMIAGDAAAEHRLESNGITWKTAKREDNPSDFMVKFWIIKVTSQDS